MRVRSTITIEYDLSDSLDREAIPRQLRHDSAWLSSLLEPHIENFQIRMELIHDRDS